MDASEVDILPIHPLPRRRLAPETLNIEALPGVSIAVASIFA